MAREPQRTSAYNDETGGFGGWHRHGHEGHRHHGHPGWAADEGRSRARRGPDDEGRGGRGRSRGPWAGDVRDFGPGRRGWRGPDRGRPGGEGREALSALIVAVRQVAQIGDKGQRQAARAVIDDAVRAIWSILAQGPTATPDAPATAEGGTAEDAPADPEGGEPGAATEA